MIRRVLLLVALLVFASSAHAGDPGFDFYEKQARVVLKTAGQKVWEAADDARKQGFYANAIREAERAIGFDPEHADARDYLKYTKRDGKWVQDEAEFKKMPQENVRPSRNGVQEPEEAMRKREAKWEEDSLKKANRFVAARYAELGDICAAKGFAEQAQKGWEAAMRLDKENEKARKGLGYTKFGKVWLTKAQDEARKKAAKPEVVKSDQMSEWETLFGTRLNVVQSLHVRMESLAPLEELQAHCEAAETAYAYYLADFQMDPGTDVFGGKRSVFVVMTTEDQWNRFIDHSETKDKEFARQLGSLAFGELGDGIRAGAPKVNKSGGKFEIHVHSTPEGRRDAVVHRIAHQLNRIVWKVGNRAWVDEGLAYYYTAKVLDSTASFCVGIKHGDYANPKDEGGMKDWASSDGWKPLLKELVTRKADAELRAVMNQKMHEMQFEPSIKAWSVVSSLMDLGRDKFMEFLRALDQPKADQEAIFQSTFGMGIEAFDAQWRELVRRTY